MHNCRLTKNALTDLALDELPPAEAKQLMAELSDCATCREEYATIRNTWRVSSQALRSSLPTENFWPGYHARLKGKLIQLVQNDAEEARSPVRQARQPLNSTLWQRISIAVVGLTVSLRTIAWKLATTSVRVPVPVALALGFLFGISVLALRPRAPAGPMNETPSSPVVQVETRTVQVPVIQEKVVTRVVYVKRKSHRPAGAATQLDRENLNAANQSGKGTPVGTAMSLVGFKPTDQVKLTIIKGSYRDKK